MPRAYHIGEGMGYRLGKVAGTALAVNTTLGILGFLLTGEIKAGG